MAANGRPRSDAELIDELSQALAYERKRAPADLLVLLAAVIVLAAALCVGLGMSVDGVAQVVLLNLSTELAGALVTVILMGMLWQQLQRYALGSVDALSRAADERRQRGLTDAERVAFERVLEVHRRTASAPPLIRQVRALAFGLSHRNELKALEWVIESGRAH